MVRESSLCLALYWVQSKETSIAWWPVDAYYGRRARVGDVTGAVAGYIYTGQVTWRGIAAGAACGFGGGLAEQFFPWKPGR